MTPRRGFLRPSLFALLAFVSTRVPACEYGSYPNPDNSDPSTTAAVMPASAPAPVVRLANTPVMPAMQAMPESFAPALSAEAIAQRTQQAPLLSRA